MKRHRRHAAIRVTILAMRTALAHLDKAQTDEYGRNLARLQYGYVTHRLGDLHCLRSHELAFETGVAVLE